MALLKKTSKPHQHLVKFDFKQRDTYKFMQNFKGFIFPKNAFLNLELIKVDLEIE